jgi:hypothetical protein
MHSCIVIRCTFVTLSKNNVLKVELYLLNNMKYIDHNTLSSDFTEKIEPGAYSCCKDNQRTILLNFTNTVNVLYIVHCTVVSVTAKYLQFNGIKFLWWTDLNFPC